MESKYFSINEKVSKFSDSIYPIYTANDNNYKKEAYLWVYINEEDSVKNKLNILTSVLSKVYFENLPIKVSQIKDIDGKKIAVVNLKESEKNQNIKESLNFKGISWERNYFQGSTGGSITSTILIETILQRDYKGSWIDGVIFKYNNQTINSDHVFVLKDIIYR